jgi:hypothetical protein
MEAILHSLLRYAFPCNIFAASYMASKDPFSMFVLLNIRAFLSKDIVVIFTLSRWDCGPVNRPKCVIEISWPEALLGKVGCNVVVIAD